MRGELRAQSLPRGSGLVLFGSCPLCKLGLGTAGSGFVFRGVGGRPGSGRLPELGARGLHGQAFQVGAFRKRFPEQLADAAVCSGIAASQPQDRANGRAQGLACLSPGISRSAGRSCLGTAGGARRWHGLAGALCKAAERSATGAHCCAAKLACTPVRIHPPAW